MALTYALARRGHGSLPPELWLLIFRFVERGWFVPPGGRVGVSVGGS